MSKKCEYKNEKGICSLLTDQCFHFIVKHRPCPVKHKGWRPPKEEEQVEVPKEPCRKCGAVSYKNDLCWECFKSETWDT